MTLANENAVTHSNAGENLRLIRHFQELIRKPSITPDDAGCTQWLTDKLNALGFECESFTINGVTNLIATIGQGEKSLGFAGHTDVVPTGNPDQWLFAPFSGQLHSGMIYGRGSADMKSGIACMLDATEQFIRNGGQFNQGKFTWLITSDEEGEAEYGTRSIVDALLQRGEKLDACIVGEPTATQRTGDTVKVGRRGSISGELVIDGKVGHVAYPQHIENPVHHMGSVINALNNIPWEKGSHDFPGTTLQITHIQSGSFVDNVSPAYCRIHFNIRYSRDWCEHSLNEKIHYIIAPMVERFTLTWDRPCVPYLTDLSTKKSPFFPIIEKAIVKHTGQYPSLSTSGGTSDGRFIAQLGCEVYELGVPNKTIHQYNESVSVDDLIKLRDIYQEILTRFFLG